MGLFNAIKEKRNKKRLERLSTSMREAFTVLFPNGINDHDRQIRELYNHFKKAMLPREIESHLVFILTGYLITGNFKTKEHALFSATHRKGFSLSKNDAEFIHNYAVQNHPKLSGLSAVWEIESLMSKDGYDTDTIPGGSGLFGYSVNNPIPAQGVTGIYDYFSRLFDEDLNKVEYSRVGTTTGAVSNHPIDVFQIQSSKGTDVLYFSAYQKRTSQLSPSGYILLDNNNVIISSGGSDYPLGYRYTAQTKALPKLIGLESFFYFSDEELQDKPSSFKNAETQNRKAVLLFNSGEIESALDKMDKAISLGSLNAVNNKFAILHTAERYSDALEFLEGLVDSRMATTAALYNLSTLFYNGEIDTHYNLTRDINRSYSLLCKASLLKVIPSDCLAKNASSAIEKMLLKLEAEDSSLRVLRESLTASTISLFQKSTPTTDIYGNDLRSRISDIYSVIHDAAESMVEQMVNLPKVTNQGMAEVELIIAGILSYKVEKELIIQALLANNLNLRDVSYTNISNAMTGYLHDYEFLVLNDKRYPLLDFAKTHGKLKILHQDEPDISGNNKVPIFVDDNSNITRCRFGLEKEEQTPTFIAQNKYDIVVEEVADGDYLFRHQKELDYYYDEYMRYLAFYIYCSPLHYRNDLTSIEIDAALANIKRRASNVIVVSDISKVSKSDFVESSDLCPDLRYAFEQGVSTLNALGSSLGIID